MVCGRGLVYQATGSEMKCMYCGRTGQGHILCPDGHYVCDSCHNRDAMLMIEEIARTTGSDDPVEIAELMMSHPGLPMLGCQHAFIAGGALMAAIRNQGARNVTRDDLEEVFKRTEKQAHGGYCGLTGVCGIAPAIGACFSVLTGSQCGKDEEQRVTMEAVTRVSRAITDMTGPSCCKAYVRTSLEAAVQYLAESLHLVLPDSKGKGCVYVQKHPHGCREMKCRYFTADVSPAVSESPNDTRLLSHSSPLTARESSMENLLKKALDLGAERARIIDTNTVIVEEWVRWKCQYGCPLYDKDGYHAPCAPDAESTKKVLKEYSKAILMNSSQGKPLTEAAVKLEGEAYRMGYYKALSMTALSSGPAGAG